MTTLALLAIGLVAGFGGGLLGIGGSLVIIPALVVLEGPDGQHLYQATAMIVNFFVVAPAVIRHHLAGATLRAVVRRMIPAAVVGAALGVFLSERAVFRGAGQGYLQILFAVFLLYVLAYNVSRLRSGTRFDRMLQSDAERLSATRIVAFVGLPTGVFGGLLGVGGGLIAVPAQQAALRIPLTSAIANSAATILWSSIVGAAYKNWELHHHGYSIVQSARLALCLIPTAMIGSWIAARRVHQWPVAVIRVIFAALLIYCGVRVFTAGWGQVTG